MPSVSSMNMSTLSSPVSADTGTSAVAASSGSGWWYPNRTGIRNYAINHSVDPESNNEFGGDDCTDFVSKVLHYGGGLPESSTYNVLSYWNYDSIWGRVRIPYYGYRYTYSWGGAAHLAQYLVNIGSKSFGTDFSQAGDGSVIFVNWQGTEFSKINHSGIVVRNSNGYLFFAQHSHNRMDPWPKWWAMFKRDRNGNILGGWLLLGARRSYAYQW
jgi:hypothetical protein